MRVRLSAVIVLMRQALPLYEVGAVASAVDADGTQDSATKSLAEIHAQRSVNRGLERYIKQRHLRKANSPEPFVVELLRKCVRIRDRRSWKQFP